MEYDSAMPSRDAVFKMLYAIPDPEMPISIVDLGLVEDVRVSPLPLGEGPGVRPDPPLPSGEGLGVRVRTNQHGASGMPSPQPSPDGRGSRIEIHLLPTFIGCPALDMIAGDVRAKVGAMPGVESVTVNWLHDPPWSVDRISAAGRTALREHGVTVPERGSHLHVAGHASPETVVLRTSAVPCPFCGSGSTYLDSPFGPTRCRTIYYCTSCRNSFERLKRI